jgi:hypothetical protein
MKKTQIAVLLLIAGLQIQAQTKVKESGVVYSIRNDSLLLSKWNTQFIRNFITNDTVSHNQIIWKDFICISSNGDIIGREAYMKDWAHGYDSTRFVSFTKDNESIRIFGDMALVRSETLAVFRDNGNIIQKKGLYTDTYIRINGQWWCVQAQLTPRR